MQAVCKWVIRLFILVYVVALGVLVVGTFGLFGQEKDPLSGIFLLPIGLPWVFMVSDAPDPLPMWIGVFAPLLNVLLLMRLCRGRKGR